VVSITVLAALAIGPAASATSHAAASRGDWPQAGFDPAHTNFNPYERVLTRANVGQLTASWNLDAGTVGSPAVVGGTVYAPTATAVNAYDATTGELLWSAPQAESLAASVAVNAGVVYAIGYPRDGTATAVLSALAASDGSRLWKLRIPSYDGYSLVIADGLLYASTRTGTIDVVDVGTHAIVRRLRGQFSMSSAIVADGRVFAASQGGDLFAFDATTGKQDWPVTLDKSLIGSPTFSDGIVVEDGAHNSLYALDEASGETLWSFATGTKFAGGVAIAKGTVYFGDYAGTFRAFDLHTGEPRWSIELGSQATDTTTVAHGVVYTITADKNVHALDARSGAPLLTTAAGARPGGNIVVSHGNVYVAGATGHLRRWVLPD
jgi:outer membrane protein assembly factor BamB